MKKNLLKFAVLLVLVLSYSCSDDDANQPQTVTIADFVSSNPNYSSLEAALARVNLTAALDGNTQFTVFAPDNDAFAAFLDANSFNSLDDVPDALLTQVLLNHVVSGRNLSSSLSTGYVKTLAEEPTTNNSIDMYINTSGGVMINGDVSVLAADIQVDNGVIHAVDKVIGLPTVVTFALADATFETLVSALTADASFTFVSTLSTTTSPAPFTVFAPTNMAFGNLLTELGANSLDDIATSTLESTLLTHVVAGANVLSTTLTDGMTVTTIGDTFMIDLDGGASFMDQNGRTGNIIVTDVQAYNGVVHVVDEVILPNLQ